MLNEFRQSCCALSLCARKLLIVCVMMIHFTGGAHAESVTFAWDPNSEPHLAGYNVYRSNQSGVFTTAPLNGTALLKSTSFTDSSPQTGTYYYVVRAVSVDGKESASSNEVQLTLAPPRPNAPPLLSAGSSPTINLPDSATLTATATDDGLPYGALTYRWTVVSGTGVTLASPNSASTQAAFSAAGAYTFRVTVSDGQLSSSAEVAVTVNERNKNTPPAVFITAPSTGATVSGSTTVSAYATDDAGVAGVQFTLNGANLGAEVTTAPYSISWDTAAIAGGSYTLSAVARDLAGNQTAASPVSVIVSNIRLAPPRDFRVRCSANGKTFTISWNSVASAENYYLRVDYPPNNANGQWYATEGLDFSRDAYTQTSFTGSVVSGQTYNWWAYAANKTGIGPSSSGSFNCVDRSSQPEGGRSNTDEWEAVSFEYPRLEARETSYGVAIISLKNGDNLVSETSVPASAPMRQGRIYVNVNGAINTGLAVANDEGEDALISFYFTDHMGKDFAHGSFTLDAKHNITAFMNQPPFNLPVSMEGSFTFSSSIPVAVTALRGFYNQYGEFLMSTLPVVSMETQRNNASLVLPHFADGSGWSTQVVLTNPTNAPLAGTVQFLGNASAGGGSALTMTINGVTDSQFNYTIAPRGVVRLVTANASRSVRGGYILVSAPEHSRVPEGVSILSFSNEGIVVSETAIPAVAAGTGFHTYVERLGVVRPALAIANSSAAMTRATLELKASDGSSGFSASIEIPAGGHLSRFIDELFPGMPDRFAGMLRIVSTQPVAATGLRLQNNQRGDLLIAAMPVSNSGEAAANNSGLLFAFVVNGGGYSTNFINVVK